MPPRRVHERDDLIDLDVRLYARWETERDVVRFAVLLLVWADEAWRPVELFDCSHGERNDRHIYAVDGTKGPARTFHHGTPGEAMRAATGLILTDYRRMIDRWHL